MNIKRAAPITFGIVTFSACATTATIAHYADGWVFAYFVAGAFALFAAVLAYMAMDDI